VLSNALDSGRGRIDESHRLELVTALQGIESERPDLFSPALRRLYEASNKPIIPEPDYSPRHRLYSSTMSATSKR
jgi:hypothetical protein